MPKRKILLVNEFSALSSGYSNISRELMPRLYASGKFELAELAAYANYEDTRALDFPWKFFWTAPVPGSQSELDIHNSHPLNQFGRAKFEETLLAFKPDIVWGFRDWYADKFIVESPFRRFFHYAHMTTCDASPQQLEAMDFYRQVDSLVTYSEWARDLLTQESNGVLNPLFAAPPGADVDTFVPVANKSAHKVSMGIPADSLVIGCVNRNQPRKLFPNLVEAFVKFISLAGENIANRSYLLLQTSYPDLQHWPIPRIVADSGVANKILLTHQCLTCGRAFLACWGDAVVPCPLCKEMTARTPSVGAGISRQQLAKVIQCFDLAVQLANCEGFGMGQVECASAGVPVASTNYSAMQSVVRQINGFPIKVAAYRREQETFRNLACPDSDYLAQLMLQFLSLPEPIRHKYGVRAREGVLEHFTYDATAKKWETLFESLELTGEQGQWNSPAKPIYHPKTVPQNLSNSQWLEWCTLKIAGEKGKRSLMHYQKLRDLNNGFKLESAGVPYTRDHVYGESLEIHRKYNHWEEKRVAGE